MSEIQENPQNATNSLVSFAPTPRGSNQSKIVQSSAVFGVVTQKDCQAIQDSVIKVKPSAKTLLLQQVETLGKTIAQVIALEIISNIRINFKEQALLLLQGEVNTQLRSLHYHSLQFAQKEFIEARKEQISKVELLMTLLPTSELKHQLQAFFKDDYQSNIQKINYIQSKKNYHCVLLHDQTGSELLNLIKMDSREMARDAYFLQTPNNPQLKEFWKLTIIHGVQQNKFSYKKLNEFQSTIQQEVQQEIKFAQSIFEEIKDLNKITKQQLQTLRLLYDAMCVTPQNELGDIFLPEIVQQILVNTSLLISDESSRLSLIDEIESQLQQSKEDEDTFIFLSHLFMSTSLQLLMEAYAENCKNNQIIDPELFEFRTILPQDQKILEQLLLLPTNNETSQMKQKQDDNLFDQLNYVVNVNDSESSIKALKNIQLDGLQQLLMFQRVHESAFEQIMASKTEKKLNLYSHIMYLRNFNNKGSIDKIIDQVPIDYKDDFQDLLVAINKYNEKQQEQFLNSARQLYKKEFKEQLQQLSKISPNQTQQAINLIFSNING